MQTELRKIYRTIKILLKKDQRNRQAWNLINNTLLRFEVKSLGQFLLLYYVISKLKKLRYKHPDFQTKLFEFTNKNIKLIKFSTSINQKQTIKNNWIAQTKQYIKQQNPLILRIHTIRNYQDQNPNERILQMQQNWREIISNQQRKRYQHSLQQYFLIYVQKLSRAIAEQIDDCNVLGNYNHLNQFSQKYSIQYYRRQTKKPPKLDLRILIRNLIHDSLTGRTYQLFIDQIIQEISNPVLCQYTKYLQMPVVQLIILYLCKDKEIISALALQIKHIYRDNCQCSHIKQCIKIYELKIKVNCSPQFKELDLVLGEINSLYQLGKKIQLVSFLLSCNESYNKQLNQLLI